MKDYVVTIHYDDGSVEKEIIEARTTDEAAHKAADLFDVDFNDVYVREWVPSHV